MNNDKYNFSNNLIREKFKSDLQTIQNLKFHAQVYLKRIFDVD